MEAAVIVILVFVVVLLTGIMLAGFCTRLRPCVCCNHHCAVCETLCDGDSDSIGNTSEDSDPALHTVEDNGEMDGNQWGGSDVEEECHGDIEVTQCDIVTLEEDEEEETEHEVNETDVCLPLEEDEEDSQEEFAVNNLEESLL